MKIIALLMLALATLPAFAADLPPKEQAVADYLFREDFQGFLHGRKSVAGVVLGIDATATAEEVQTTFAKNGMLGHQRYANKKLLVTGEVGHVGAVPPYVFLTSGMLGTMAKFGDPHADKIASLRKGDNVAVVCTGVMAAGAMPILTGCALARSLKDEARAGFDQLDIAPTLAKIAAALGDDTACGTDPAACGAEIRALR